MKIISIVGARPQFIKVKPIVDELKRRNIKHFLVHTGQHYDYQMSKIFFDELSIPVPDYNLEIGSFSHSKQTALALERIEKVLLRILPSLVVVYGDTNSTLAGALSAAKLNIPVAHIEAGLRSFRKDMPEEVNRVLTDHISTLLFCLTITAVRNLKKEGIVKDVYYVGDVMYDVLISALKIAERKSKVLDTLDLNNKEYCVLTIHRAENTNNKEILKSLIDFVSNSSRNRVVIFPIHPRTKNVFESINRFLPDNIKIIEPLGYFDLIWLVRNASLIFTDSGGLQKEASWLKTPTVTLREETEWPETISKGWNILYRNFNGKHIPKGSRESLGMGLKAAKKIVNIIIKKEPIK